ncbi:MAG TPA: hypothetical protein DHV36_25810 [Desulfobacteraceae bacterium]|nr:hypothetical protein [Desulfobacteraceae bacterium]
MTYSKFKTIITVCSFILILPVFGCNIDLNTASPQGSTTGTTGQLEPAESTVAQEPAPQKPTALYFDFQDILVPMELDVVKDRTVIVSTPGFKSGILTLKGMVDSDSLFTFFSVNMEKDNWQELSKIKSPGTTIMVYQKTNKCAVITIRDHQINTYVEIGVAPSLGGGTADNESNLTY